MIEYGVPQVNGATHAGEFVTGKFNFFQFATLIPCAQTNVKADLSQVHAALNVTALSATNSVTILDGTGTPVTYTSDASYSDALAQQANLDLFMQVFATRVNPVMLSVTPTTGVTVTSGTGLANGINAANFGSNWYSSANSSATFQVSYINIAVEKGGGFSNANPAYPNVTGQAWLLDSSGVSENNTNGYQFLGVNGIAPVGGIAVSATSALSAIVGGGNALTTASFGTFITSGSSNDRNLIGTVRQYL
jgi:hypothetical protein